MAKGAYYTPPELAVEVAAAALPARPPEGVILDPSCGDGALLAAARDRLRALGVADARIELCGVDADPLALAAARERLGPGARLVPADFLLGDPELPAPAAVVANPPFLSVKRADLDPREREALRARYRTARGQFDACACFLERVLSLLPAGRRWASVLPRPVLGNDEQAPLRRLLLDEGGLDLALDAGAPFGAAVETVVLAGSSGPSRAIRCRGPAGALPELDAADVRALPGATLPIGAGPGELAARARAARAGTPLGEVLSIRRGIEAGKRDPALVAAGTAGAVLVRAGDEVRAHALSPPRRALSPGALPPARRKPDALYRGPKLLVRRVAPGLVAAVDEGDLPVLNTLYVLHGEAELLHAAAAALNSAPLRRWFELTFVAGDRLFPYVRASQLAAVPLPLAVTPELARAGRRLARGEDLSRLVDEQVAAALG